MAKHPHPLRDQLAPGATLFANSGNAAFVSGVTDPDLVRKGVTADMNAALEAEAKRNSMTPAEEARLTRKKRTWANGGW